MKVGDSMNSQSRSSSNLDLQAAIRKRAEEIYVRNGRIPGRDVENWAQAEREVREEVEKGKQRKAIVVKVNGVQYVGEYTIESAGGYVPGEFAAGEPIAVRLEGEKMYVRRSNGQELETRIVKKAG